MIYLIFILKPSSEPIRVDKGGDSEEWMYWFRVILLSKVRAFKVWLLVTFYATHEHDENKNALMHIWFIWVHGRLWQNRRKQVFLFNFFCCSHHSSQTFLTLTNPAGIKEHNSLRRGTAVLAVSFHFQSDFFLQEPVCNQFAIDWGEVGIGIESLWLMGLNCHKMVEIASLLSSVVNLLQQMTAKCTEIHINCSHLEFSQSLIHTEIPAQMVT